MVRFKVPKFAKVAYAEIVATDLDVQKAKDAKVNDVNGLANDDEAPITSKITSATTNGKVKCIEANEEPKGPTRQECVVMNCGT